MDGLSGGKERERERERERENGKIFLSLSPELSLSPSFPSFHFFISPSFSLFVPLHLF